MNDVITVLPAQLALIKKTIAATATADELALYLYDCQRQGVHPLDKLIHFTKRGGKYVPITSIDFLRKQAGKTGEYAGADDGVFTGEPGKAGFACSMTVYRFVQGTRCAWTATARWEEYYPGEAQGMFWKRMPHVMMCKISESLCLRKAFADSLHGLYTHEEMAQADAPSKEKVSLHARLATLAVETPTREMMVNALDEVFGAVPDETLSTPENPAIGDHWFEMNPAEYHGPQVPLIPGPARTAYMGTGWPIGKHKGTPVEAVPDGYLRWAVANMTNEAVRALAADELARRAEAPAQ